MKPYGQKPVNTTHDSHREKVAGKRRARQQARKEIQQSLDAHFNSAHLDNLDHDKEVAQMEYYDYHDPDRYEGDGLECEDHDRLWDEQEWLGDSAWRNEKPDTQTPEEIAFDQHLMDDFYYWNPEAS